MKSIKAILLIFIIALAIMPSVAASYISIKSTITAAENKITIKVTNLGDEAAYNVQLSMDINNKKTVSSAKRQLGMRESFEWEAPLGFKSKNPGKYPIVLTTSYEDANSYPFSAISVSTFDYKEGTVSDVAAAMGNTQLSDKGTLELKIKNTGESAKDANIRLIAPKELTVDKDKLSVKLPAKSEMPVKFEIEKFSALAGSSYAVFAIIEYDEDGRHYTAVINGAVKIKRGSMLSPIKIVFASVLIATFLLFIYFQFHKKRHIR